MRSCIWSLIQRRGDFERFFFLATSSLPFSQLHLEIQVYFIVSNSILCQRKPLLRIYVEYSSTKEYGKQLIHYLTCFSHFIANTYPKTSCCIHLLCVHVSGKFLKKQTSFLKFPKVSDMNKDDHSCGSAWEREGHRALIRSRWLLLIVPVSIGTAFSIKLDLSVDRVVLQPRRETGRWAGLHNLSIQAQLDQQTV